LKKRSVFLRLQARSGSWLRFPISSKRLKVGGAGSSPEFQHLARLDINQLRTIVRGNREPFDFRRIEIDMAKPATLKIKLLSSAGTGFFYVTKKNPRTMTEKMVVSKYDPVARKHVEFKETKIK